MTLAQASRDAYAKGVVTMQSLELEKADLVSKIAIQQAGIDKASEGIIAVTQARADAIAAELSKMSESVASKEEAVDVRCPQSSRMMSSDRTEQDLEGDIAHLVNESKKNEAVRSQISTDLKDAQAVVDQITGQTKVLADLRARIKKAEEESRAYGDRIAQAKSRGQQRERETKDVESRIEAAGKSSAQKVPISSSSCVDAELIKSHRTRSPRWKRTSKNSGSAPSRSTPRSKRRRSSC